MNFSNNSNKADDWDDSLLIQAWNESWTNMKRDLNQNINLPIISQPNKQKKKNRNKPNKKWAIDDFCLAIWEEDSCEYLAKILNIDYEKGVCEVIFPEYGNIDFVEINKLKPVNVISKDEYNQIPKNNGINILDTPTVNLGSGHACGGTGSSLNSSSISLNVHNNNIDPVDDDDNIVQDGKSKLTESETDTSISITEKSELLDQKHMQQQFLSFMRINGGGAGGMMRAHPQMKNISNLPSSFINPLLLNNNNNNENNGIAGGNCNGINNFNLQNINGPTSFPPFFDSPISNDSVPPNYQDPNVAFQGMGDISGKTFPLPNKNGVEDEALAQMLISWYMTGYHTGFYQGFQHMKTLLTKGYCKGSKTSEATKITKDKKDHPQK